MSKELWKPGNMLYPLPVVMVSLADAEGHPNIITLAWVGTVCTNPPMVSISVRPERYSYPILKETGEFVINLTTKELTFATDYCGVKSGRDVDKFKEMGLTAIPASVVKAPMIGESPVNIGCDRSCHWDPMICSWRMWWQYMPMKNIWTRSISSTWSRQNPSFIPTAPISPAGNSWGLSVTA